MQPMTRLPRSFALLIAFFDTPPINAIVAPFEMEKHNSCKVMADEEATLLHTAEINRKKLRFPLYCLAQPSLNKCNRGVRSYAIEGAVAAFPSPCR